MNQTNTATRREIKRRNHKKTQKEKLDFKRKRKKKVQEYGEN